MFVHKMWVDHELSKMITAKTVPFPMLSDAGGKVGEIFGVYDHDAGVDVRGRFLIDPDGIVQGFEVLSPPVGRNVGETLRQIQAFQLVRESKGTKATPRGGRGEAGADPWSGSGRPGLGEGERPAGLRIAGGSRKTSGKALPGRRGGLFDCPKRRLDPGPRRAGRGYRLAATITSWWVGLASPRQPPYTWAVRFKALLGEELADETIPRRPRPPRGRPGCGRQKARRRVRSAMRRLRPRSVPGFGR